jgi:hypothetical protein
MRQPRTTSRWCRASRVAARHRPGGFALGRPTALNCFTAQVARVAHMEQDGRTRYLTGCRFLGRVEL